ncbi:hypothetical protein T484DRAFT_1859656 [Baffinella frigidus]|nr:hypothetical protein T484DRAFT_1859656 [Cryptophyta sp. CCMP2293]
MAPMPTTLTGPGPGPARLGFSSAQDLPGITAPRGEMLEQEVARQLAEKPALYLSTFILGVYRVLVLERTQLQPACLAEAMAAARTHFYLPSISCSGAQRAGAAQRGAGRGAEEARGPEAVPLQPHTVARLRKASASRSGQSSLSRWTEPTLSSSLDLGSHHSRAGPDALKSGSSKPRRSSTSPSALLLSHVASVLDLAVGSTPILAQRVAALREASDVATFQHAKYWFQNSSFLAPHPASVASAPGTEKMGSKVAGFSRFRFSACCFA